MIAEFAGLPGSGKSTAARLLISKHFIKRSRISRRASLLFWNFIFSVRYPIRAARLFVFVVRHSPSLKLFYYKFTNLFLHVNGKHMKAKFLGRALVDQGYAQNCLSLFEKEASRGEIASYLRAAPLPDEVVVFDAPREVRETRIAKRDFKIRDEFDPGYRKEWKEVSEKNWKTLLEVLPAHVKDVVLLPFGKEEESLRKRYEQKRLIYAANFRLPTEKAHGFQIAKMCESFADLGQDVTLLLPTKKKNPIKEDLYAYYGIRHTFKVKRVFTPDMLALKFLPSSWRFFLQGVWFAFAMFFQRIDKEAIYYLRNPELVWLLKLRGATRVIFEAHLLPKKKRLFKACVASADLIPCNSKGTLKALADLGIERLTLAPNGVDLEAFLKAPEKRMAREELGLPQDKKIVLYSGHLYAWKGVRTLIEAAKQSDMEGTMFYLIGGKADEIEALKKDMRIDSEDRVVFREHVPHTEVYSYLKAADVLVLPNSKASEESVAFTSPIKMFEYMASGTPIIASSLPSIREVLDEGSALLFTPDDPSDLLNKVKMLLEDETLCATLSLSAQNKSRSYSWIERAKNIISI